MRVIILIGLLSLASFSLNGQNSTLDIWLKEFHAARIDKTNRSIIDTIIEIKIKGITHSLFLKGHSNKFHAKVKNSKGQILKEGYYINLFDTLVEYSYNISMGVDFVEFEKTKYKYFQALRDGEWLYYDKLGKLKYKIKYNKGSYTLKFGQEE